MDGLRLTWVRDRTPFLLSILAIFSTAIGFVFGLPMVHAEESLLQGPIKGVDVAGNLCRVGEQPGTRGIVVVFLSTQCPISNAYLPLLSKIASNQQDQGIEFYGVISDPSTTLQEARQHSEEYDVSFPVLFDGSGELRMMFAPTHTPEAFVLDHSHQAVYRGAIDDLYVRVGKKQAAAQNHFLANAIQCVIENQTCSIAKSDPIGCRLETPPNKIERGEVTFNRDIAPIIQAHCAGCHRPNRSGPFELLTYKDLCAHANQIVEVTQSRLMPPWKPESGFAPFHDQQRLSGHEISLIRSWVENGKPQGDPADLPTAPAMESDWPLGEPDMILTMSETFDIPSSGPDVRQYFVIPTDLDSDRLISAIDFHPGSPTSVHHASFYLDDNHLGRKLDAASPGPGYKGFGGPQFESQGTLSSWLPGMSPRRLPAGMGRLVKRDADIVAEIHYITTGKPEQDRSKIGIYFAPPSARQVVGEIQVGNKRIEIPADNPRHLEHAYYTLPVTTLLLDIVPHMHVLGSEIKVYALLPNGRSLPLLWIKQWDFDWQGQYAFMKPVLLPQGTRISVDAWFNNSSSNPLNPNSPPRDVRWGDDSTDEMLLCTFQGTCKKASDLEKLIEDQKRYIKHAAPRK